MDKPDIYIALGGIALSAAIFAWLCLTSFANPLGFVVLIGVVSFITGYVNGRG